MRFLVGPWSDGEIDHQKHIAAGFNALHPDVTFEFRLYQWDTAAQEISTSAAEGAHDIYMTTESSYPDYEAGNGFEDLTSRINDPSFAAEKAKYLYWDRTQNYGPKLLGLPISWHVEDALFVNMDKVAAAGHDETFVNSWDSFHDCVSKMTKPGRDLWLRHRDPARRLWRMVSAPALRRRILPDPGPQAAERQSAGCGDGHPADGRSVQGRYRAAARHLQL